MGIDARMFARVSDANLSPEAVHALAVKLAQALGSQHFTIVKPGKYDWWPNGRHALSLSGRLGAYIEEYADHLSAPERAELESYPKDRHVWVQDGDPIIGGAAEQFIECHLVTRYYGEGYERGDWPTIRMAADWLRLNIPGCEVWYGGDSSGVCAEHLTLEKEAAITAIYLGQGREPYLRAFDNAVPPSCTFCQVPMHNMGGGGGQTFLSCTGCGDHTVIAPDGRHDFPGYIDFFGWREKLAEAKAAGRV